MKNYLFPRPVWAYGNVLFTVARGPDFAHSPAPYLRREIAIVRFRHRRDASPSWTRVAAIVAALVLVFAGYEGGYLVYHGATGIEPDVLASELRAKQEKKASVATRHETGTQTRVTR